MLYVVDTTENGNKLYIEVPYFITYNTNKVKV